MADEWRARGRVTLDPKLDIVFWMLFGAEQNRGLLVSLLNAVLSPSAPIDSIEVLHAQPERTSVDDKSIALDLRVRLGDGSQIDVEMQSQRRAALRERALYYWARLYAGQPLRGASYADLRRCVVVLFTNYAELTTPRFHSLFQLREQYSAELLTDRLELHLVELPKLHYAVSENDEPDLAAWGKFLAATSDEELERLAMDNPVLRQAKDALDRLSADPDARIRAEMREMALLSYEFDYAKLRREGKAEGKAEGRVEGKTEFVLELLTEKFGELTAEARRRVATASEPDLLRWSKRLLSATSLDDVFTQ